MDQIKVFIDSNVLFSIAYSGKEKSRSYLIYEIQDRGLITVYLSNLVCAEAVFNIRIKRSVSMPFLEELIGKSTILEDITDCLNNADVNRLPNNDRIILTTAVGNKMDCFLTGNDQDFGKLYSSKIGNTIILKPADFLNRN